MCEWLRPCRGVRPGPRASLSGPADCSERAELELGTARRPGRADRHGGVPVTVTDGPANFKFESELSQCGRSPSDSRTARAGSPRIVDRSTLCRDRRAGGPADSNLNARVAPGPGGPESDRPVTGPGPLTDCN